MSRTSPSPILSLTLARLREFYRQPEAVFWVYFFPVLMVIALGIAFRNKPVEQIKVDAIDSMAVSQLTEVLGNNEQIEFQLLSEEAAANRLRTGKSDLYLREIPSEDTNTSPAGIPQALPQFEVVLDPTRPGSLVARDTVNRVIQEAYGRTDPVTVSDREVMETGGRYIDFLIPGLLGMGLMGGGMWGVGFAIVDMRIRKLLKRFLATPMKRWHFLLGVMISRLMFMVPEIILLLVFSRYAFGVQVYGNWLAVIAIILIGAFEFSGIGLLVASRARTLESVSGLMNLVMLPMWTVSGIFFSYERFPESFLPIIRLLPLTPLIDALRAVMLEGATLGSQWPRLLIMIAWGLGTFVVALRIFRWRE